MADWNRVKWSEASQVLEMLGDAASEMPEAGAETPAAYFDRLRAEGLLMDAARFLGQALPRLETVGWAARSVRDLRPAGAGKRTDELALRAALLWVGDPTESRRHAAYAAATACDVGSPERLAALAAFFSGGSIAPPDYAPVPAPREAAGRFAAGAVLTAAVRSDDIQGALARALDAGADIACRGLESAAA